MNAAARPRTRQGNRAGRSVVAELKSAPLSGEFGMKMLRAKFSDADEILARLGVYSRGPRKGEPRGYVTWRKVTEGGWDYARGGGVVRPGCTEWDVKDGPFEQCKSIVAAILRERREAERLVEDEARAARVAAEANMSPFEKQLSYARKARIDAHAALLESTIWGNDEFHDRMQRAIQCIRKARELRAEASA